MVEGAIWSGISRNQTVFLIIGPFRLLQNDLTGDLLQYLYGMPYDKYFTNIFFRSYYENALALLPVGIVIVVSRQRCKARGWPKSSKMIT